MRAVEGVSGRVVALDLGEVRCGVAISDSTASIARPLEVVPEDALAGYLRGLFDGEDISEVVVGIPRTLGGEVGHQAERALRHLEELKSEFSDVRFVEWDERFTTRLAASGVQTGGRRKKRGPVDDLAAAHMLQEYLQVRGSA